MKSKMNIIVFCLVAIGAIVFFLNAHPISSPTKSNNVASNKAISSQNNNPEPSVATSVVPPKKQNEKISTASQNPSPALKVPAAPVSNPNPSPNMVEPPKSNPGITFLENFNTTYSVAEADKVIDRTSPGWWLGSGAYFYSAQGIGSTLVGKLRVDDPFRIAYSTSNPVDTDNGYYPQNIFRLVLTRGKWLNFRQEADFEMVNNNLSKSPNRNESNGLLFFNRYQDADNLYYTGIRVDGAAVIKKKINGTYYELSLNQFYKDSIYNHETNPNLIPKNKWIGLRSEIKTNPDNTVNIKLFIDKDMTGDWVLATEATDDGKSYGGAPILDAGYTGIRTDFMDVQFDNYKVTKE